MNQKNNTSPKPGTIAPADGSSLEPVAASSPNEIHAVVEAARKAQASWAARSLSERSIILETLGQRILKNHAEISQIMSLETGRSPLECTMSELVTLATYIKNAASVARQALKPERVNLSMLEYPGKRAVIELVPRGVIAVIAPWNYPLANFWKPLFPALLAGNAVVIKPSEYTPRTGAWLAKQCDAMLPPGLVGIVQGAGDVGTALLNADVDAATFTGSVATGKRIAHIAAERLIPVSLELGGKDAAIVLADCDLDRTVAGIAQWSMHNCGQNCAAIERVYVEDAIADRFVDRLGKAVSKMRVAHGEGFSELGPMQSEQQLAIVESHIADALAHGATLVTGGKRTGIGLGFEPTVIDHCSQDMRCVAEETFGPTVAIIRVKDSAEAVRLANDTPYGLNGSVWTKNIAQGERIARKLHVGVALVNNHAITGTLAQTPWTGVKDTGFGVAASRHSYHTFARPMTVFVDRSSKPDPWWAPANEDLQSLADALLARAQGSIGATFKLAGILGRRVKAITSFAREE